MIAGLLQQQLQQTQQQQLQQQNANFHQHTWIACLDKRWSSVTPDSKARYSS